MASQVRTKQIIGGEANVFLIPNDYLVTGLSLLLLVIVSIPEKTMSSQDMGPPCTGHRDLQRLSVSGARAAHYPQTWKASPKQTSQCRPRVPGHLAHQRVKPRSSLTFPMPNTTTGHIQSVLTSLLSSFSLGKARTLSRHNSLGLQFLGDPRRGSGASICRLLQSLMRLRPATCGTQCLVIQIQQMLRSSTSPSHRTGEQDGEQADLVVQQKGRQENQGAELGAAGPTAQLYALFQMRPRATFHPEPETGQEDW